MWLELPYRVVESLIDKEVYSYGSVFDSYRVAQVEVIFRGIMYCRHKRVPLWLLNSEDIVLYYPLVS
jgi:hypothetical protein